MSTRVLYLSYDGLTDPLGQSQVLPYLTALASLGHQITVISCDKPDAFAKRGKAIAAQCREANIRWHSLRYRKSPPVLSTLVDLAAMARLADRLNAQERFDIVHCRSYLTALIGRRLQRRTGTKFLFDMRGFWIDERFERGIWDAASPIYRAIGAWFRRRETELFQSADAVVSLTHAARSELGRRGGRGWTAKTAVVPCCADLELFSPEGGARRRDGRSLLGLDDDARIVLVLGSLGGGYPLAPVRAFFDSWAGGDERARLLFVTRHAEREVRAQEELSGLDDRLIVRAGEREEMPSLIAAADVGTSFILPSFCAIASSPTKVGEMLAIGVPVVANSGVGDMAKILAEPAPGILLADLELNTARAAAAELLERDPCSARARDVAKRWFSLNDGVATYDRLYRDMGEG